MIIYPDCFLPHTTGVTAGQKVLSRNLNIHQAVAMDTKPIRDGLCSTERLRADKKSEGHKHTHTHVCQHLACTITLFLLACRWC